MGISSSIEPDNHLFIYSPCSDLLLCVPLWLVLCHSQLDLQLLITPLLHTMPQHQLTANHQYTTRPPNHTLSNTVLLTITLELNSAPKLWTIWTFHIPQSMDRVSRCTDQCTEDT